MTAIIVDDREEINSLSNGLVQVVERFKGQTCFATPDDERGDALTDRRDGGAAAVRSRGT
jgi:hypothetical protein